MHAGVDALGHAGEHAGEPARVERFPRREHASIEIQQAAVNGLALTIGQEHPELRCTTIDLDGASRAPAQVTSLTAELLADDRETRVAWRRGSPLRRPPRRRAVAARSRAFGASRPRAQTAADCRCAAMPRISSPAASARSGCGRRRRSRGWARVISCSPDAAASRASAMPPRPRFARSNGRAPR